MTTTALNRGIAYPLTVINGMLATVEDLDLIKGQIFSVIETVTGERLMRPTYGTPVYLFTAIADMGLVAAAIQGALEREIPQVLFSVEGAIGDEGIGLLSINWAVANAPQPPIRYQLQR